MKIIKLVSLSLIAIYVASCATVSKEQCLSMNWQERGKIDAMNGEPLSTAATYDKACGEYGIKVDKGEYKAGRTDGLKLYCTNEIGHKIGSKGKKYQGVCPAHLETEFLKGYRVGQKEYELDVREAKLRARENEVRAREDAIHQSERSARTANCTFNSDCKIKGNCRFNKCENNGMKCTFDSDCEIQGRCSLETEYVNGHYISVNQCKY